MNNSEQTVSLEQLQTLEGAKTFFNNIPEECKKNLTDVIQGNNKEEKTSNCIRIREAILSKPYMQDNTKYLLKQLTENLVKNNNQAELEQLNKGIDFTENGGLIAHTSLGDIKFSHTQVTFEDIKDIDGIEENINVLTKNTATGSEGLWVDPEAINIIKNKGKKLFSTEEYLTIIEEVFSGVNNVYKYNKVFFDILGGNQYGIFSPSDNERHENMNRCLYTDDCIWMVCDQKYNNGITAYYCFSGIRFIE